LALFVLNFDVAKDLKEKKSVEVWIWHFPADEIQVHSGILLFASKAWLPIE